MISRLAAGVFMPQSFSFLFQQHTHLQVKHEPPFSVFCLLPIHIAVWRPSLHLHLTACRCIWLLIGQMLRVSIIAAMRVVSDYSSLLLLSCLRLTWRSTYASLQRCSSFAHLQRMGPLVQNGAPHGSWGPLHSTCSACGEGWRCL